MGVPPQGEVSCPYCIGNADVLLEEVRLDLTLGLMLGLTLGRHSYSCADNSDMQVLNCQELTQCDGVSCAGGRRGAAELVGGYRNGGTYVELIRTVPP